MSIIQGTPRTDRSHQSQKKRKKKGKKWFYPQSQGKHEPASPVWKEDCLLAEPLGKPHVVTGHSYIVSGEISVQVFGPFIWVVSFVVLSLRTSLYIQDVNLLSGLIRRLSPILWVAFLFCWYCPLKHKFLKISWYPVCLFFLLFLVQEIIAKSSVVPYIFI